MSLIKNFVNADIQRTKALAVAMKADPIFTSISVLLQTATFVIGLFFFAHITKWAFATITAAF